MSLIDLVPVTLPSTVTAIGTRRIDATSVVPLFTTLPVAAGVLPLTRSQASCAADSAWGWIALYTVMNWSPARIRWTAATSASCPVTNFVFGSTPPAFMAAIAPPAPPSLATYAPSNPVLPSDAMNCSMSCWASSGFQFAMASSLTIWALPWNAAFAPLLKSVALLSFGEPLMIVTFGFDLPAAARPASWVVAWRLPTDSLSNEM